VFDDNKKKKITIQIILSSFTEYVDVIIADKISIDVLYFNTMSSKVDKNEHSNIFDE